VAELSQQVATAMKLTPRQIDDIRVAALLYDMGHIEVTTKVIRRAVGAFEENLTEKQNHTFQGMDLMLSLGSVLSGAVPLLLDQGQEVLGATPGASVEASSEAPVGAKIIRAVRAYFAMLPEGPGHTQADTDRLFQGLREDPVADHDRHVLEVLRHVVSRAQRSQQQGQATELAVS
jgi:HD-GYP domain-containing protein (c-di-GMP phosphodiesterase class II)